MHLYKRNESYYYIKYFDEATQKVKRISTKTKSKKEALQFLADFKGKLKTKPAITTKTLEEFREEYQNYVKLNFSSSYHGTVKVTFNLLIEKFGDVPLSHLSYKLLDNYFAETFKRTKEGARTYYIALKSAFNKAVAWGYMTENHLTKIKLPKIPKNNPLFINEKELDTILEKEKSDMLKDIYVFAFDTGLRLGEIINLRWDAINFTEEQIQVLNSEEFLTKGKKERSIPMNQQVLQILQKRLPKVINIKKPSLVFSINGRVKLNKDYVSKRFKKCVLQTAINPKFHFHDLRHSFASNLVKKGVSIFVIKELLGHQDVKTTQIYSHIDMYTLRNAIKLLDS